MCVYLFIRHLTSSTLASTSAQGDEKPEGTMGHRAWWGSASTQLLPNISISWVSKPRRERISFKVHIYLTLGVADPWSVCLLSPPYPLLMSQSEAVNAEKVGKQAAQWLSRTRAMIQTLLISFKYQFKGDKSCWSPCDLIVQLSLILLY